eukprot:GHUV01058707.1.p1 GENE.GHUV01058707.1~~GHUV01058707.1.p1  ORF type:complete len:101 (-),score=0.10 GHUV01058707.1:281-583(-)
MILASTLLLEAAPNFASMCLVGVIGQWDMCCSPSRCSNSSFCHVCVEVVDLMLANLLAAGRWKACFYCGSSVLAIVVRGLCASILTAFKVCRFVTLAVRV